ncbi:MAG: hypothetical protein AAFV43_01785 [Planctomycetota bacterium]
MNCSHCAGKISLIAEKCPSCGRSTWFAGGVVAAEFLLLAGLFFWAAFLPGF